MSLTLKQGTALPHYQCHKLVRAAKIAAIDFGSRLDLMPVGSVIEVGEQWVKEKKAEVGGYYVEYDDGYASFSPAAAFEAGYTRVPDPPANPEAPTPGLPPDELQALYDRMHSLLATSGVNNLQAQQIYITALIDVTQQMHDGDVQLTSSALTKMGFQMATTLRKACSVPDGGKTAIRQPPSLIMVEKN